LSVARAGIFIELPAAEAVEMAGWAGWDFCVIDCEHAPIQTAMLPGLLRASRIPAYVRVPNAAAETIQGALDCGADGVIVPRLRTVDEAEAIAAAARFYPRGRRGVNHMVRAAKYSLEPAADYLAAANGRVRVIAQIETAEALFAVDRIAAVDGIDELFVGPYDLSQALEIPGQVLDERLLEAGRRIVAAGRAHGVAVSVFVNSEEAAQAWLQLGADALHYSADAYLLAQAMRETRARVAQLLGRG
jgi:4-hydroxy-2-oxoheptanedioate aldolase